MIISSDVQVMTNSDQLLLEIAHCDVARDLRDGNVPSHRCKRIVASQTGATFQLPVPWVGQIDRAPVLFVSSNPSIDEYEEHPTLDVMRWPPERTIDFFENLFTSARESWVKDGRPLRQDGSRGKWVRFWASAHRRASELLQIEARPGIDFALTEIVHCKSRNEFGVSEAQEFCSDRYLQQILDVSAARVVVVYGCSARDAICRHLDIHKEGMDIRQPLGPLPIEGIPRMFVFLPHPNSRGQKKSLEDNLDGDGLSRLRMHLTG